jgi:hypothetical protein
VQQNVSLRVGYGAALKIVILRGAVDRKIGVEQFTGKLVWPMLIIFSLIFHH